MGQNAPQYKQLNKKVMSDFNTKLDKHIDKVISLQNSQREQMLSLDELKEIDLSLGVTEEEWEKMMQKADAEVKLAQNHFYYKNYKDAYLTAESAISINPHLTQARILLADSALKIYETDEDEDYLLKAENHAKEVLKFAPAENRAIEILALLNKYKSQEKSQKNKIFKYSLIGGGVLVIILSILFFKPKTEPKVDNSVRFALIDAEENANAKWAQVENIISRRDKIIPQLFALIDASDETIDKLKVEIEDLQDAIKKAPEESKIGLQANLQAKYENLTKLISSKNNSENITTVLIQIEGSYNRIAVEGKRYNEAVKTYNILVKKNNYKYPNFKIKPYFKGR